MSIDFAALSHTLRERGTNLGPPVDEAGWRRFSEALPVVPGADFRAVYSAFDGFETTDAPSHVRLWSCDEIAAHRNAGGVHVPDLPLVCIGNFLIESDYRHDFAADAAPVRWSGDDEVRAPSLRDFVVAIAAGRFDF